MNEKLDEALNKMFKMIFGVRKSLFFILVLSLILYFFVFEKNKEINKRINEEVVLIPIHNNQEKKEKKEEIKEEKGEEGEKEKINEKKERKEEEKEEEKKRYSYPLPPKPNPLVNNSTLLGIDTSEPGTPGYGVRDDVERKIVEVFGDDERVTLAVLNEAFYSQKILELYEKGGDDEVFVYLLRRVFDGIGCGRVFSNNPEEYYKFGENISNIIFNTVKRKKAKEKVSTLQTVYIGNVNKTESECQAFLNQAKEDRNRDIFELR